MDRVSRREFLEASAAAGLRLGLGAGIAAPGLIWGASRSGPSIAIAKYKSPSPAKEAIAEQARQMTTQVINAMGGMGRFVAKGDVVWVKPNIGWNRVPEQAATTNPDLVETIVSLCYSAGARKVMVSDNSCNPAPASFARSGIQAAAQKAGAECSVLDVVLVAFNYTMANNTALLEAISGASKAGIGLVAMKTQAGGGRRPDRTAAPQIPINHPALLKWVLRHTEVATAIPGYTTYEQMEQNFSVVSNLELSPDESQYLSRGRAAASLQFCHQCAQCRPACPQNADIPAMMRAHMYAVQYGNYAQAASTLAMIGAGQGLDACHKCAECSATCRNSVNIAGKIGVLKQLRAIG